MEDKEVGKLWADACSTGYNNPVHYWKVKELIRKLVDERVRRLKGSLRGREPGTPTDLELALAQFGIDPETFK